MDRGDLFVWVIAPLGLVAAAAATWFALRKRNWLAMAAGSVATLAGGWVTVTASGASTDSFDDLAAAAVFALFVTPMTILSFVLSFFTDRKKPRWAGRFARS